MLCLCGIMLVLTGFKAALAAEIVSFWICISAALLDLFSPAGFPSALGRTLEEEFEDELIVDDWTDEAAVEVDPAEVVDGSAVIRSISVVPDESCKHPKKRMFRKKMTKGNCAEREDLKITAMID